MNKPAADIDPIKPPKILPAIVLLGTLAFFAAVFQAMNTNTGALPEGALVENAAPPFDLQRLESDLPDERMELAKLVSEGKPIIMNFWASWCTSCAVEARDLEAFWQVNKGKVTVVGVALQDKLADARQFAAEYDQTYPLAFDKEGRLGIDYGIMGLPETFLIDAKGVIRKRFVGAVTAQQLEEAIVQMNALDKAADGA